jgi:FtsH-binding integral membrane protein
MLSFYQFNFTSIVIIFVTAFISFFTLGNFDKKEEKGKSNIRNGIISLIVGVVLSILVSYFTIESDTISNTSFWGPDNE